MPPKRNATGWRAFSIPLGEALELTASNVVITEDGSVAPNNWGTYTTNSGSPSDSGSGVVATVSAVKYTDTIASLGPGVSAVFTFKRSIN